MRKTVAWRHLSPVRARQALKALRGRHVEGGQVWNNVKRRPRAAGRDLSISFRKRFCARPSPAIEAVMGKKKKWSLAYSPVDAHCLETLLSMGYARDTARRALEDPKSPDGISLRDLVGDLRELYNGATEPPAVSEE